MMNQIHGMFTSKRGVDWKYTIYSDGFVVQWHPNIVRCTGGWKQGSDTYSPKPTRECFKAIMETYGLQKKENSDYEVIMAKEEK